MAGILVLLCSALVILAILFSKGEVVSPSFLLSTAFLLASVNLFLNRNEWYFNDKNTVLLIVIGIFFFELGSFMIDLTKKRQLYDEVRSPDNQVSVSSTSLYIYFAMQFLLYFLIIVYVCHVMGAKVTLSGLSEIVGNYYISIQSGTIAGLPGLLNIGQIVNTSGIYYLLFLLVLRHEQHLKIPLILLLNVLLGIVGSLLTGTKTSFFMYLVSVIVMHFFLKNNDHTKIQKLNIKNAIEIGLLVIIVIGGFNLLSSIQGRNISNVSMTDTISTYIGAPIKNLEIFITSNEQDTQIFGAQTFADTYKWLYKITNNSFFQIVNLYKYNWVFNKGLGNVYTIFMPLFNDFGYLGAYIIMFLLGCFSQTCYNSAKFKESKGPVNFRIIFYSYLSFAIFFSFFSNKMFEMIFSRSGFYFLIGLYIFDFLFRRLS